MDTTILNGKVVALIEDNITNMAVFATILRQYDVTVIQDNGNFNPVNFLTSNLPVDLILLDIMLKRKTGYTIFDQIQKTEGLKGIPVVAISSLDPAAEIPKLQASGFSGFISKPINVLTFPEQIATCISGGNVWATGR